MLMTFKRAGASLDQFERWWRTCKPVDNASRTVKEQLKWLHELWNRDDNCTDGPGMNLLLSLARVSNPALARAELDPVALPVPPPAVNLDTIAGVMAATATAPGKLTEVTIPAALLATERQYLPRDTLIEAGKHADVLDLRGGCGTGKSEAIDYLIGSVPEDHSVLLISANQAIARDQTVRFARHNMVCYMDVDRRGWGCHDLETQTRLICSLESIERLGRNWGGDNAFVIIDESVSVFSNAGAATVWLAKGRRSPYTTLGRFRDLITRARVLVLADAYPHLGAVNPIDFVRRWRPPSSRFLIIHSERIAFPKQCRYLKGDREYCIAQFVVAMAADIRMGLKVVFVSNSKTQLLKTVSHLCNIGALPGAVRPDGLNGADIYVLPDNYDGPPVLVYHGDNRLGANIDVNEEWRHAMFIAYTPTIRVGVSNTTASIDRLYCYHYPSTKTCTVRDTFQAIYRFRNVDPNRYTFCVPTPAVREYAPSTIAAVKREYSLRLFGLNGTISLTELTGDKSKFSRHVGAACTGSGANWRR